MKAINLEANDTNYLLSIDTKAIAKEVLLDLIERMAIRTFSKTPIMSERYNEAKKIFFFLETHTEYFDKNG